MRLIAIQPILSFPCFVAAVCDSSVVNLDSACSLATFCRALESTWGCRCLRVDYLTFCSGCGGISYRIRCEHFIRVLQATGVKYSSFLAGVIDSAWFLLVYVKEFSLRHGTFTVYYSLLCRFRCKMWRVRQAGGEIRLLFGLDFTAGNVRRFGLRRPDPTWAQLYL